MSEFKERPILFSAEMVCALLAGTKTQTRRIMKSQPHTMRTEGFGYTTGAGGFVSLQSEHCLAECPYGKPGDRLWVRESFQPLLHESLGASPERELYDYKTGKGYAISYPAKDGVDEFYDLSADKFSSRITPSIHMPRWVSRITLEITEVRVQRLQEISEEDAVAEGCTAEETTQHDLDDMAISDASPDVKELSRLFGLGTFTARAGYGMLWDEIYGQGSWNANPYVWAVSFKVVQPTTSEVSK